MTKTRSRSCDGKRRHATKQGALLHAFSRRRAGATKGATQVYRCEFCRGFHVGHLMRRRR